MHRLPKNPIGIAVVGFSLVVSCHDLRAQTAAATSAASTAASTSAASAATGMGMGTGMGGMELMPMMSAMNPTASLSPTDAAALGMQGPNNGGAAMMNGLFMNPMAAPYMFGMPMSNTQIAGMMMMNQMNGGGIGSGQLSGVRPGSRQTKGRNTKQATSARGTASTPAGLATKYFNRTVSMNRPVNVSRIPQSYYTRQNRYYPQVAR